MTYAELHQAVQSAAAFRCRTVLQPAGGEGDKVFPPTYAGAVYATEQRRVAGEDGKMKSVPCVLLDSVQSQANRMELALQREIDEGQLKNTVPVIEVDFSGVELLDEVGRITSLEAPHRAADAILRDGLLDGVPFRKSDEGKKLDRASLTNATPLYEICPTALVFGIWDSTGPKGGMGAKFQRALVSEIVGINIQTGVKTSSRIDPLQIRAGAKVVVTQDSYSLAAEDKSPGAVKPSEINHGNITPDLSRYNSDVQVADPLRPGDDVKKGRIAAGGVTLEYAEQTTVLSLPALRRLRFPLGSDGASPEIDAAGRTVLAALALVSAVLAAESGYDLRSRCLLWPSGPITWELLDKPGEVPRKFTMDRNTAVTLLKDALKAAEALGLRWRKEPLKLVPSPQLIELVRRSQEISATGSVESE